MPGINEIIETLSATRQDFSQLFLRAQYNLNIPVHDRYEFEAITRSADDKQAFKEALDFCRRKGGGLYEEVLGQIIKGGFDGGALLVLVAKEGKVKTAPLQAITNAAQGFMKPLVFSQGVTNAYKWTGKVLVNNEAKGSGILIGPKRFLTAWHVVRDMFDPVPLSEPVRYEPKKDPPPLQVVFDDYDNPVDGKYKASDVIRIDAAEDWLEIFSSTHEEESQDSLPSPQTKLKDYWDYAIIHLARTLDNDRNWVVLEKRAVVPDSQGRIILFQYPNGNRLAMDIDVVTAPEPPNEAVPGIRFLHQINANPGSSGGPCFDKDFYLVGLHQGVWCEKLNGKVTNRGVPIRNIILDMEARTAAYASASGIRLGTKPEDYLVWYTDKRSYDPIIGVDDLQFLLLNNARSEKGYVLRIQGDKGSGKTFCVYTLFSLLNNTDHLKMTLPADTISKMDAVQLARLICSTAGADIPKLEDWKNYNTTIAAWLRDEVTPKVIDALDARRNKRTVWICIINLNRYEVDGKNTWEFLLFLFGSVTQHPWLQFVVDGLKYDLPTTIAAAVQEYTPKPKTLDDIKDYISRFLQELKIKADATMIDAFSDLLFTQYKARLDSLPEEAMGFLSTQCKAFFTKFMKKINEN